MLFCNLKLYMFIDVAFVCLFVVVVVWEAVILIDKGFF